MNCHEIRELLPDLAAGMDAETTQPEVKQHIASCDDCAAHLRDLQKTMALLDEWQAPEPSPYFDTRLQARIRENAKKWRVRSRMVQLAAASGVGHVARCRIICGSADGWHRQQVVSFGDRNHRHQTSLPRSAGCSREPPSAICRRWRATTSCTPISMCSTNLQVQDDVTANP